MYRLIIVDDEYEIRNGLSRYFPWESIGFTVAGVFENGKDALKYILHNPVDVVLTDIEMPVMTGIELARAVYLGRLPVKVIFLSAYRKFEYAQDAISYRVVHYITKPTVHSEISEVFCSVKKELDQEDPSQAENPAPTEGYYENLVQQIKDAIAQDLKNATIVSVAEQVGRSPSSVSRLFLEATGMTFTDYLKSQRMEKANELLNCIDYKIYEVSEMVGYSNAKNFARAYKNYFGYTPHDYRQPKK